MRAFLRGFLLLCLIPTTLFAEKFGDSPSVPSAPPQISVPRVGGGGDKQPSQPEAPQQPQHPLLPIIPAMTKADKELQLRAAKRDLKDTEKQYEDIKLKRAQWNLFIPQTRPELRETIEAQLKVMKDHVDADYKDATERIAELEKELGIQSPETALRKTLTEARQLHSEWEGLRLKCVDFLVDAEFKKHAEPLMPLITAGLVLDGFGSRHKVKCPEFSDALIDELTTEGGKARSSLEMMKAYCDKKAKVPARGATLGGGLPNSGNSNHKRGGVGGNRPTAP